MFTDTSIATKFKPRGQAPSVSPHFPGNIAMKASQPFVEFFLIYHEFLNPKVMRNLNFSVETCFFSEITALTER